MDENKRNGPFRFFKNSLLLDGSKYINASHSILFAILYLSTTDLLRQEWIVISILFVPLFYLGERGGKGWYQKIKDSLKDPILLILLAIAALSFVNRLIHLDQESFNRAAIYSFGIIYPINYFVGRSIVNKNIRWIIYAFVSIEILVGLAEYISGVSTFFTENPHFREFQSYRLLYFTRVLGLSHNSATLAIKIFMVMIMLDKEKTPQFQKFIPYLRGLLILGLFLTFNRAVFVACFAYWGLIIIKGWRSEGVKEWYRKTKRSFARPSYLYAALLLVMIAGAPETYYQFKRGMSISSTSSPKSKEVKESEKKEAEMEDVYFSGRVDVWKAFYSFTKENWIFGNGSAKYWKGEHHAHNSFLEVLASHGVIISILYMMLIAIGIFRIGAEIFIPVVVLGCFQYAIFWGLSFPDFLFLYFLTEFKK